MTQGGTDRGRVKTGSSQLAMSRGYITQDRDCSFLSHPFLSISVALSCSVMSDSLQPLEGFPDLPGAPQHEAHLTRKFETSHVGGADRGAHV